MSFCLLILISFILVLNLIYENSVHFGGLPRNQKCPLHVLLSLFVIVGTESAGAKEVTGGKKCI